MVKHIVYRLLLLCTLLVLMTPLTNVIAIPFNNLFNPYDILLFKPLPRGACYDFDITYEGSFAARGFQADPDDRADGAINDGFTRAFRREVPVLQLWHDVQNIADSLAGTNLKTFTHASDAYTNETEIEKLGNLLNLHSSRLDQPQAIVCGDFKVPFNVMLAARMALPCNFTLGVYLPFYRVELNDVHWRPAHKEHSKSFTEEFSPSLNTLERLSNMNLSSGWHREGIGDLAVLLWWFKNYPQAKPWLKNVLLGVRGGLTFPTGGKQDLNRLFGLPLGNDGGVGLLFGGTLELAVGYHMRVGIDGEFLNLFGSTDIRHCKTAFRQTDLLLFKRQEIFKDPGFTQHYTIYLKLPHIFPYFSATAAYQHTRQHESNFVFNNSFFDSHIANSAESLQDWTTHSIIGLFSYDARSAHCNAWLPSISAFVKHGFNGKRAILFDTAGFQLNFSY